MISIASLLVLTGVCIYATLNHLSYALQRPIDRTHLYFAGMCVAVIGLGLSLIQSYRAETVADYVTALKWAFSFIIPGFVLFPWFIASFTSINPRLWLTASTLFFLVMFPINLIQPYSLQYNELYGLEALQLPWGETVTQPLGHNGVLYVITVSFVLANIGYALYAFTMAWRRRRERLILVMLSALVIFLATAAQGVLVRADIINFIHLGPYGMFIMIIVLSIALSHDIRQKIQDSERRFRLLVEQSPFSVQVMTPEGKTRQVNKAWSELWGVNLEALADYNILEDRQLVQLGAMPYIERGFAGEILEIPPIRYNPANNSVVSGPVRDHWVRAYIYSIKDDNDVISDVILMHEDVSRKKQTEDIIHLMAASGASTSDTEFFQQLVLNVAKAFDCDHAFIGILDDADKQCVNTLAVCARNQIAPNLSYKLNNTPCANVIGQRTCVYQQDVQHLFPQDKLLAEMNAESYIGTPLFDVQGNPFGLLVVLDNKPLDHIEQAKEIIEIFAARASVEIERKKATEEREAIHQQFLQAQKMESIGRLAAGVAHDFNNYLSSILGYSDLALTRLSDNDPYREDFQMIYEAGQRASMVTRQLLSFSRKQMIEMTPVEVSGVVRDIMKILRNMLGEDISVVEQLHSTNLVLADRGQLEQIIMNLAVNARDAMPAGGNIVIETEDIYLDRGFSSHHVDVVPGYYTMLSVTDSGEGIESEHLAHIFEPFFTTKDSSKGTGLGLAVVHGIIKQHNGHIFVTSEEEKGTTFRMYFPVTTEAGETVHDKKYQSLPHGTQTILIVDDEPSIRRLIVDTLEPLGYTCLTAANGNEAMEITANVDKPVDILLTDVIMPGMKGKELFEKMKAKYPSIKTLFVSGYTDSFIDNYDIVDDAVDFIAKPVTPTSLAFKLHNVLNTK